MGTRSEGRRRVTCQPATFLSPPVANLQSLGAALPRTDQSLLILDLRLNLDAPRLDALLERHGQSQHAVAMRRGEFLQVQELGDREGLFVARGVLVLLVARDLGANAESLAGNFQVDIVRIDARQRDVDAPAVVGRIHLERRYCTCSCGCGAW